MKAPPITAALTLSLTGRYERQGTEAAHAMRLWAEETDVRLILVDDHSVKEAAVAAYSRWMDKADLLIGPYGSGLVRAVAPSVRDAGRFLWNHGGSADDLARPGIASLPAPASSYFDSIVDHAANERIRRLLVIRGSGPFARAVADGARARACFHGMDSRTISDSDIAGEDLSAAALFVAGPFEHDAAIVRGIRERGQDPALLAAVAAGIVAFGRELGEAAEGVVGPVQWWPQTDQPTFGPSGTEFASQYQRRVGRQPSYTAAQAAAAGHLAYAAHNLGLDGADVLQWTTSTLLGDFALNDSWQQVGHKVTAIRWHRGRMVPLSSKRAGAPGSS
ncbi:MAG: ABC transporter substrate-binding protein [Streptosporangiales bacterium]